VTSEVLKIPKKRMCSTLAGKFSAAGSREAQSETTDLERPYENAASKRKLLCGPDREEPGVRRQLRPHQPGRDVQQGVARHAKRVINTHEDGDHVWGNQLYEGAEIIAHLRRHLQGGEGERD
jgi:hypothetical protein